MKNYFCFIALYGSFFCYSQQTKIDTLSFDLSRLILIIDGKVNNVPVKFAFDTGAGLGIITNALVEKAKVQKSEATVNVHDSNNQKNATSMVTLDSISIGSFTFTKHQGLLYDMPFLKCGDYFLLGGDVINKLHWKFNFNKKEVYISNAAFTNATNSEEMPFTIKGNTHFTDIYINNKKIKNVLIDFGYNGFFEINKHHKVAHDLMTSTAKELMIAGVSTSVGVFSTKKDENVFLKTQTISFDKKLKKLINFNINIEDADTKLGLDFFVKTCDELVINPFEKKYSLLYKSNTEDEKPKYLTRLASILFENEKLVVVSKLDNQGVNLEVGEVIESIDGRKASSFNDFCDYLDFMFTTKDQEIEVIKTNGKKVLLKKILL